MLCPKLPSVSQTMKWRRLLAGRRLHLVAIDVGADRRLVVAVEVVEHQAADDRGLADPDLAQQHDLADDHGFRPLAREADLELDAPVGAGDPVSLEISGPVARPTRTSRLRAIPRSTRATATRSARASARGELRVMGARIHQCSR